MITRKPVKLSIVVLLAASVFGSTQMVQAEDNLCATCAECQAKLISGLWPTVVLTADIIDHSGDCIGLNFGESNVAFDCNGHLIDSDGAGINPEVGISIRHGSGVTITNCTISDFDSGIFLVDASNNTVSCNHILSNHTGIELTNVEQILISDNAVSGNSTGIKISTSNSNQVLWNSVCDNIIWDIYYANGMDNVGDGNSCDTTYLWSEGGTPGCTFTCSVFVDGFESGDCSAWTQLPE